MKAGRRRRIQGDINGIRENDHKTEGTSPSKEKAQEDASRAVQDTERDKIVIRPTRNGNFGWWVFREGRKKE